MRSLFSSYALAILELIIGASAMALMFSMLSNTSIASTILALGIEQTTSGEPARVSYDVPVVQPDDFVVDNAILELNSDFDWHDYVHVRDSNNNDLINYIVVSGTPDTSQYGSFTLIFTLNWNGKHIEKEATYYVRE